MSYAHSVVTFVGTGRPSPRGPGPSRRGALFFALVVALVAGVVSFGAPAFAQNRVVWKQTKIKETDKAWKIAIEVYLDRVPDVAHMPVRFSFTPVAYFERALVDGKKEPVNRQIPLSNQQPIVESVDVGFLDPGTGKAAKRTRFSFHVTRDRGFEAGIYDVVVTDGRSDREFCGTTTLTFDGENEVIDRRSVVFDDKPKPKKDENAHKAAASESQLTPDDEAFWAGGPKQAEEKQAPLPPPAHMQERPGCGCRIASPADAAPGWGVAALGLGLLVRRCTRETRGTKRRGKPA